MIWVLKVKLFEIYTARIINRKLSKKKTNMDNNLFKFKTQTI